MLNILITIDTEAWQSSVNRWNQQELLNLIQRDVYGSTSNGEFGLRYLIESFQKYDLKANFMVEPLFSYIAGHDTLKTIVSHIMDSGNDVQLHLHPEWLRYMDKPLVKSHKHSHIKDYSLKDQSTLIKYGIRKLNECGVESICAFRAGDYAANDDTLNALQENNIYFDTSYNFAYLNKPCEIKSFGALCQPVKRNKIIEVPVGFYEDYPGHFRHTQLTACSNLELEYILTQAWRSGYSSIVIVLHTFELIYRNRYDLLDSRPDLIMVNKFRKFCKYLSNNRDKYRTTLFSDLDSTCVPKMADVNPLKSNVLYTAARYVEQLYRKMKRPS